MTAHDRITDAIAKCPWDPNTWFQGHNPKVRHKLPALCRDCAEKAITEAVAERDEEWSKIIERYIGDDKGGYNLKVAMHAAIRKGVNGI